MVVFTVVLAINKDRVFSLTQEHRPKRIKTKKGKIFLLNNNYFIELSTCTARNFQLSLKLRLAQRMIRHTLRTTITRIDKLLTQSDNRELKQRLNAIIKSFFKD